MIKFGTDGWRAVISKEFTFDNVARVAQAIADHLKRHNFTKKGIIVGYDPRFLADRFAKTVALVLISNGIKVYMPERDLPTPIIAYAVKDKGLDGAIMLTASHNPPEYCGIKFITHYAGPATDDITKEIEADIPDIAPSFAEKEIPVIDPLPPYMEHIKALIDFPVIKKAKLKVVYDAMNGAGRGILNKLLQDAGCQVEAMNCERDVLFGGKLPEPSGENLPELKEKVKTSQADLGLATDGDADRFGIVDEKGNYMEANLVEALVVDYLLGEKKLKGSLVRSVGTTHQISKLGELYNVKVHETAVGFKHIAAIMMQEPVVIGGEESGGFSILGHIPEKDGILANLLVVEMLARKKKKLSQLVGELNKETGTFITKKINLKLTAEKKKQAMEKFKNSPPTEIAGVKVEKIVTMDGVKMICRDKSWVLVRPSGTEPILRIYFEASTQKRIDAMLAAIEKFVL